MSPIFRKPTYLALGWGARSFALTFTSPGLDPGVFFGGAEEDAPVGPGQGGGGRRVATKAGFRLSPE